MDPLTFFPPEVCDSILQYLTGNEILEASKVSKTWYSFIGTSSKIMQRIKLNLFWLRGPRFMTSEMKSILIESHRRYQNVVMKFQSLHIDEFKLILQPVCRNWRSVKIERLVFNSAEDLIDLIKVCGENIEELEIDNIYAKYSEDLKPLNLPKLKILELANVEINSGTINEFFVNCSKLEMLNITSNDVSSRAINAIKLILKKNHNLKRLELTSQLVNSVFDEDVSYEFKLHTFITSNYCHLKSYVDYQKILINQFGNLKNLSFDETTCLKTLKLIFKMPSLKSLNIGNIDTSVMILSKKFLSVNKTIEELSYQDMEKDLNIMKYFVDATPNLKKIEMFSMTQDMMEYLSPNAKQLEMLKLRTLEAANLSSRDLFPKLKEVKVDILSSNVESNISAIPVAEANPLVFILLRDSNYIVLD